MKIINIICGLQTYSSMHHCTWCDVKSKCLAKSAYLRTLGSVKPSLKPFQQSDGIVDNPKLFGNVILKPIISGPDNVLLLEIIPPMELHLFLGVINNFFKILNITWVEAVKWPAALLIQVCPYHEGQFNGNECRKLPKNADVLQQPLDTHLGPNNFYIIEAFKSFNIVVKACFGFIL